jgi:hypothetical protein
MNTKKITVFVLMVMVLSANAISNKITQDKETITIKAIFDGYDSEDGYSFLVREDESDEDSEAIVYFSEITEDVLKTVNLKSKEPIGKRFEITYEITEYDEIDDNGTVETYESYKIIKIRSL